jgi:hypothetical protein
VCWRSEPNARARDGCQRVAEYFGAARRKPYDYCAGTTVAHERRQFTVGGYEAEVLALSSSLPKYSAVSLSGPASVALNVSKHLPLVTVPEQVSPLLAVTVTSPVTAVLVPLLTVKYTVTFRGFLGVRVAVFVIAVVVPSSVAVVVCVRLVAV